MDSRNGYYKRNYVTPMGVIRLRVRRTRPPFTLADSFLPRGLRALERDLPELLTFFDFPRPLWRKLCTTNAIKCCFVEVRRRTRPMVVFTNVQSVERIIYAIFSRFNEDWKNHTLALFTQAA